MKTYTITLEHLQKKEIEINAEHANGDFAAARFQSICHQKKIKCSWDKLISSMNELANSEYSVSSNDYKITMTTTIN